VIAVIGAGAMGSALAILHERAGRAVALLGTRYDDATLEACRAGLPHPALAITLPSSIDLRAHDEWEAVLPSAERVVLAVSSDGVSDVVAEVGPLVRGDVIWMIATKGWDPETLQTPSQLAAAAGAKRIAVLAGPALAPEIVAGAPTALVVASTDAAAAAEVASSLHADGVSATTIDDVVGAEVAAAYKNVTAVAVGICEGLSERQPESVFVHRFANARSAAFAHGLHDMTLLSAPRGGRRETILGLAGAGDLYVTCLGGRNGKFGRLLGAGETSEQAQATIGSTVEGVANTRSALELAQRYGVELRAAKTVASVLSGEVAPPDAIRNLLGPR
jgi:glycerol-3-phosphate dehydrogenase (NAD(P)+)